jgi:hypothetical protein
MQSRVLGAPVTDTDGRSGGAEALSDLEAASVGNVLVDALRVPIATDRRASEIRDDCVNQPSTWGRLMR